MSFLRRFGHAAYRVARPLREGRSCEGKRFLRIHLSLNLLFARRRLSGEQLIGSGLDAFEPLLGRLQ